MRLSNLVLVKSLLKRKSCLAGFTRPPPSSVGWLATNPPSREIEIVLAEKQPGDPDADDDALVGGRAHRFTKGTIMQASYISSTSWQQIA